MILKKLHTIFAERIWIIWEDKHLTYYCVCVSNFSGIFQGIIKILFKDYVGSPVRLNNWFSLIFLECYLDWKRSENQRAQHLKCYGNKDEDISLNVNIFSSQKLNNNNKKKQFFYFVTCDLKLSPHIFQVHEHAIKFKKSTKFKLGKGN